MSITLLIVFLKWGQNDNLKKGMDGCVIYESKKAQKVPSYKVMLVNVLGAGDAFAAGFIFGYLHGGQTINLVD